MLGYEVPQVLLIHCNEMNALTLRQALHRMRERGYTFVSLDEAMADPAYQLPVRPGAMGGWRFVQRDGGGETRRGAVKGSLARPKRHSLR